MPDATSISVTVASKGNELDLGVTSRANHGRVGHDEFRFTGAIRIQGVVEAEGCILDRDHPILFLRNIAKQLSGDVGYPSDKNAL